MTDTDMHELISRELRNQREKFPIYPDNNLKSLRIIVEEVGEIARGIDNEDTENIKEEILQTLVVCFRWYITLNGSVA